MLAAVMVTTVLYSGWWRACCSTLDSIFATLVFPGFLIAIFIGGGVHAAEKPAIYSGVVVQFLIMWWACRFVVRKLKMRNEQGNA